MKKRVLVLLAAFACCMIAVAQEMPVPMAQQNLMQFEGKWVCENPSVAIGDEMFSGVYSFDCVVVNLNTGILVHEEFKGDEIHLVGENLFGYDPNLKQVHLYSIDNMGTTHDHYGYWVDDHHLFVQYQGVVEGQMFVEQINLSFSDPNTMKVKLVGMHNGEVVEKINGEFLKQ